MGKLSKALTERRRARVERPQFRLPRYEPPRGMPKSLSDSNVLGQANADRLKGLVETGWERGGGDWYHTGELYNEFVQELGPELGRERFDRYMDLVAATSPRSRVDANIKRASYLYGRDVAGENISGLTNADFPKGYGHLAHKTQDHLLRDLEGGAHFESLDRPKVSSFAENLKGNLEPMTIDTHNRQAVFLDKGGKSPTATEYMYLEDFQRRLADELGIAPGEWQSALWVGADEITGVADSRAFMDVFEDAVRRTAARDGKTERQVMRDFIEGKAPLASILAAPAIMMGAEEAAAADFLRRRAEKSGLSDFNAGDFMDLAGEVVSSIPRAVVDSGLKLGGYVNELLGGPVAGEGVEGPVDRMMDAVWPEEEEPYTVPGLDRRKALEEALLRKAAGSRVGGAVLDTLEEVEPYYNQLPDPVRGVIENY